MRLSAQAKALPILFDPENEGDEIFSEFTLRYIPKVVFVITTNLETLTPTIQHNIRKRRTCLQVPRKIRTHSPVLNCPKPYLL
jgi:hypothetical protein